MGKIERLAAVLRIPLMTRQLLFTALILAALLLATAGWMLNGAQKLAPARRR